MWREGRQKDGKRQPVLGQNFFALIFLFYFFQGKKVKAECVLSPHPRPFSPAIYFPVINCTGRRTERNLPLVCDEIIFPGVKIFHFVKCGASSPTLPLQT
jgi:hypothetical protein